MTDRPAPARRPPTLGVKLAVALAARHAECGGTGEVAVMSAYSAFHIYDLALGQLAAALSFAGNDPSHVIAAPERKSIDVEILRAAVFVCCDERHVVVLTFGHDEPPFLESIAEVGCTVSEDRRAAFVAAFEASEWKAQEAAAA